MTRRVEADQIEREQCSEHFLRPRQDEEYVWRGEWHVEKESDRSLVPAVAQSLPEQEEMIVVEPHRVLGTDQTGGHAWRELVGLTVCLESRSDSSIRFGKECSSGHRAPLQNPL